VERQNAMPRARCKWSRGTAVGARLRAPIRAEAALRALVVVLGLIVAGALGAGGYVMSTRKPEEPGVRTLSLRGAAFTLPSGYFRAGAEGGERIDLAAFYPNFTPAGQTRDIAVDTDLGERYQRVVFITLTPADESLDPAERTARLYARFLETDGWTQPGGLIARAFQEGSPFEGDELYYVAPEGREFAARCSRPSQTRPTPNTCIADYRDHDLDVEVRFPAGLLSEWRLLVDGANGLIAQARASGTR
jgi:hypothetical protein